MGNLFSLSLFVYMLYSLCVYFKIQYWDEKLGRHAIIGFHYSLNFSFLKQQWLNLILHYHAFQFQVGLISLFVNLFLICITKSKLSTSNSNLIIVLTHTKSAYFLFLFPFRK